MGVNEKCEGRPRGRPSHFSFTPVIKNTIKPLAIFHVLRAGGGNNLSIPRQLSFGHSCWDIRPFVTVASSKNGKWNLHNGYSLLALMPFVVLHLLENAMKDLVVPIRGIALGVEQRREDGCKLILEVVVVGLHFPQALP